MKSILSLLIVLFSITSLFAQNVCTVKIQFTINKSNPPSYTFKTDPQTTGAKYSWAFGDNTFSDSPTPTHSYSKGGSYVIHVKVTTGTGNDAITCYGDLSAQFDGGTVTANVPCTVKIVSTKNSTTPASYTFKTDPQKTGGKYSWKFSDNSVSDSPTPSHTFSKTGTYSVLVKVTGVDGNICYGELKAPFDGGTVIPPVVPCKVSIIGTKSSTNPLAFSFKSDPSSTASTTKYFWSFGDETPTSDTRLPSHTYSKAGTYVVKVKVTNGTGADATVCYGELSVKVEGATTTPVVPCSVKIISTKNSTTPASYTFKTDPQKTGGKYSWKFSDNSVSDSPTPSHTFSKTGTYSVLVKVTGVDGNICYGELKAPFDGGTVVPPVVPCKVSIIGTKSSTNPLAFSFKSDPSSTASTTKYFWYFGDETPTSDTRLPSHTYSKAGTYVVKVKVTNGTGADATLCYGELSVKVEGATVTTPVVPCTVKIVSTKNSTTPVSYTFKTDPQTAGAKYYWTFGDKTVSDSPNPSHTFSKANTYTVLVKVSSGDKTCTGELKTTFDGGTTTILPNCKGPINLLLFDPANNLCNGSATVKLLDEAGKEIPNVKYLWSDGRTGSSAGTLCPGKLYTVQATIENVCQKTTSFTLLSKPLWQSTSVDGVNNFTVLAPVDGVQYEWNFGNGITKIGPSVSYNFQKDGIYDVQLKAVSLDGVSESTKQVVVMKSIATTDVINKSEVDLYPNPAKEIIRVDFKNPTEGTLRVEIKNLSGRSVYIEQITNDGSSHADINIQNLNAGMYVLRISNDQRIIGEKKFIKSN